MKRLMLTFFAFMAMSGAAIAQDTIPDITGVWVPTSGQIITREGALLSLTDMPRNEVVIEMQDGALFRGLYRWHHPEGTRLDDGETETHMAEEMLLGVFGGDGRSFIIADTPDNGYWFGAVLDDDHIELRYVESGPHAVAGTSVIERVR
ncbi:MAG: hypothetical protein AAF414_13930 [Pseudomonadota bacterium]